MDAYGVYKEFSEVMNTTKYANLPDQEKQVEADGVTEVDLKHTETEKEALLKNRMAVTSFTVAFGSCQDFYTMNIVIASKTKDWPSGKSWEIIKELQEEYAPTDLMGDAEQQKELESIRMHRHANPKELFSQITAIENKYRGRASELSEKSKLTNVILRSPDEYAQTIQTTRQLTKAESPQREPTIKELRTAMYDYYCTRRPRGRDHGEGRNRHHHEMSLYTGDDSDGSTGSRKRWSNKKKSVRNSPRDNRECYGCGKKGHIKRDCKSGRAGRGGGSRKSAFGKCSHCDKPGHQEADCWKKHPEKTPDWIKQKNKEMAGMMLDGETAFISISGSIPVETVQEEETINTNESDSENEDSDSEPDDGDSMPKLVAKSGDNDESSIDSDEDPEEPEDQDDINWDPEEAIPEFRETYQDQGGRQARQIQEAWIINHLN